MTGNVFEWCWNRNNETFPMATPSGNVASTGSSSRITRGGYWTYGTDGCRVSDRNYDFPTHLGNGVGFRVVMAP